MGGGGGTPFLKSFQKDPDTVRGIPIDINYACLFNTIFYSVQKSSKTSSLFCSRSLSIMLFNANIE